METLRLDHGVQLPYIDREPLEKLGVAAGEMVKNMDDNGNEYIRRVWRPYLASREGTLRFLRFNEQALHDACTFEFALPSRCFG